MMALPVQYSHKDFQASQKCCLSYNNNKKVVNLQLMSLVDVILPSKCLYAIVAIPIFEDHRVVTSVASNFCKFSVITHFCDIQNGGYRPSFPREPAAS